MFSGLWVPEDEVLGCFADRARRWLESKGLPHDGEDVVQSIEKVRILFELVCYITGVGPKDLVKLLSGFG